MNKKVTFLSPFKTETVVTGGQFYDRMFLNTLSDNKDTEVEYRSLATPAADKYTLVSPLLYLKESLKNNQGEIIVTNSANYMRFFLLPFFLKSFRKNKILTIHHHFMYRQFTGLKRKVYKFFEWRYLRAMDYIVVASPYVYSELQNRFPKEKLLFYKIPFKLESTVTPSPKVGHLSYTGTIETRKGLHHLIESLIELKKRGKNYPLTIMGKIVEQDYYETLNRKIEAHGLNVKFTGFIDKNEIDKILSNTDIFVFPSLLEGYGMALVEAQVYGLPIVSFDNSAMPYNVKNDINGYTLPTGDTKGFADAIERIVEDRELRARLSLGALENLKNQNTVTSFQESILKDFKKIGK